MDESVLFFFEGHQDALPLYEKFEQRVLSEINGVWVRVQKTQISFSSRYMFACVSFAKVRKAKERPAVYIVVTFGLDHREASSRIDVATEAYPGRWTHHVMISQLSEIDDELMGWVREASVFSSRK